MKTTVALFSVLFVAGCGPNYSQCNAGTLENDIRYSGDLRGPGIDADGHLKPGNYIVSTTYIQIKPEPEASTAFQEVMDGINKVLDTTPGLVAFQLATSTECLSARTISVWSDETQMMRFVTSEAHGNAIRRSTTMSRGGGGVTHWTDTETGATFEKAAQKVASETRPNF